MSRGRSSIHTMSRAEPSAAPMSRKRWDASGSATVSCCGWRTRRAARTRRSPRRWVCGLAASGCCSRVHDAAWRDAIVPSAGQVWWRAEIRARQEAVRAAARPMAVAETAVGVLAVAALVAFAWKLWPWILEYASALRGLPALLPLQPLALSVLALLAVVTPVALYLALSDE